jgi:osmotically-inducible protein OsmY
LYLILEKEVNLNYYYVTFKSKCKKMKTKLLLCVIVLFAGITFNSCKPSDEKLQKAVTTGITPVSTGISSAVKKGEVTLSGVVISEELKIAAEKAAAAVKGVSKVVNNIQVQLPIPQPVINPDDVLQQVISAAVTAGGDVYNKVVVAVKDSEVTLTGEVKRADLQKLMQIVNEAKPKKINNLLTLK